MGNPDGFRPQSIIFAGGPGSTEAHPVTSGDCLLWSWRRRSTHSLRAIPNSLGSLSCLSTGPIWHSRQIQCVMLDSRYVVGLTNIIEGPKRLPYLTAGWRQNSYL